MSSIANWAWNHLLQTRSGDAADTEAALRSARASEEWSEYVAVIEWRGWCALLDECKRRKRSGVLMDAIERAGGQRTFNFLDGLAATSRGLIFAEAQRLCDFDEVTATCRRSRDADTERIDERLGFRHWVAPIWEIHPDLTLVEVLLKMAE